jgi:hypothetical protein
LCLAILTGAAWSFAEADYFPPSDTDGGWRTLTDAAKIRKTAGMDLARLDQAFEFQKTETSQHGGLIVVRHGYLVYEKYFGKGNREAHPDMASIGKAFTSVSVGIMLAETKPCRSTIPRRRTSPSVNCSPCPVACTGKGRIPAS